MKSSIRSKVVSYQFEYIVQDEVGGYTIVVYYFHTAMVNNKKQ